LAAKAVKKDHYSVLGVTPASEDVVIRAAYHALMRRYHPDADPSEEGAELSRAINEAYAVLRDPAKRARYDESLGLKFEPGVHSAPPRPLRSRLAPAAAIGVALIAMGMVVFAMSPPIGQSPAPKSQPLAELPIVSATKPVPAKVPQRPAKLTASSCAAPETSRLIKEELFRRAGGLRDGDRAQLRQIADHVSFRIDTARTKVEQNGVVDCSGWIALDLPPGVAVDGGRTNLNAELTYALAHDRGRMRVASLSGEGRLVRTLATLGPAPREPDQDKPIEPAQVASATTRKAPVLVAKAKRSMPAVAAVRASRTAAKSAPVPAASACSGSRAEQIVCGNTNLSSLDRQLSLLYRQSWNQADEKKRAALLGTRQRFNDRRGACGSPNCMTTAYLSRLKEISDIMAGRKLQ